MGQTISLPCLDYLEFTRDYRNHAVSVFKQHLGAPKLSQLWIQNGEGGDFEFLADENGHMVPRFAHLNTLGLVDINLQDSSTALRLSQTSRSYRNYMSGTQMLM